MKAILDHVGIAVTDLAAALAFYRDALGLDIEAPEEVASQRVRAHFLPVGDAKLELLEPTAPDSPIAKYTDKRGPGLHHITLRVEDIHAALAQLKSRGARLIDEAPRPGAEHSLVAFVHPSSAHGVLVELKREFAPDEIQENLWQPRAQASGLPLDTFLSVARGLNERGVVGRFSTFLEHVKTLKTGEQVTKYNALFHWAVPPGREIEAGRQVGRFHIMTHAYWREGGPECGNVNVMGVAHGTDKDLVLAHKRAIDAHLAEVGIPVSYTNVFWGGRSEIKPSEISPIAYRQWCQKNGIDPATMRE